VDMGTDVYILLYESAQLYVFKQEEPLRGGEREVLPV
jgi:hypothetical protein